MHPSQHITEEIGRLRAEEMRARAEQYRLVQMARRQHEDSKPAEKPLTRFRIDVYRKALGILGLAHIGRGRLQGSRAGAGVTPQQRAVGEPHNRRESCLACGGP